MALEHPETVMPQAARLNPIKYLDACQNILSVDMGPSSLSVEVICCFLHDIVRA